METALPLLLFFGFLFGSGLLILVCGIQSRAMEEPEAQEDPLAGLDLQTMPRFFGRPGQRELPNPVAVVVDGALLRRVEDFLREELALAEVFVGDPSVEGLHKQPEAESGPTMFERLERYLLEEHEVAANFVSNPSIESLHGRFEPVPLAV